MIKKREDFASAIYRQDASSSSSPPPLAPPPPFSPFAKKSSGHARPTGGIDFRASSQIDAPVGGDDERSRR